MRQEIVGREMGKIRKWPCAGLEPGSPDLLYGALPGAHTGRDEIKRQTIAGLCRKSDSEYVG